MSPVEMYKSKHRHLHGRAVTMSWHHPPWSNTTASSIEIYKRWDVLQNTTDAATTCRQTTFEQHTIRSRLIDDYLVDRNHKMCYIDGGLYFLRLR
jgi:hypothetical protein